MINDLFSQMKTANLLMNFLQGDLARCTPYPFTPEGKRPMPDASLYGLPTATPESQGVESAWLAGFFTKLQENPDTRAHSVAVLRHGRLIAQGSFKPYTGAYPHMLFSLSKSVVGMAVGMVAQEGLLRLSDRLVDFFPEVQGPFRSQRLSQVTVENLLQMTAGVKYNEVFSMTDRDWVHGFLNSDCIFEPGTDFYYNSMNSYMLTVILHQLTGQGLVDWLMPRLFEPLGIPRPRWERCPLGYEKGGWGLYLRAIDMAKLGQLYLQNGLWHTEKGPQQLVPAAWVKDSTTHMRPTGEGDTAGGYGYQLWSFDASPGAYQYSGVFGQHVVVLPQLDAVVAMTSGSQNFVSDEGSEIIAQYFGKDAPGFHEQALPHDLRALRRLKEVTANLYAIQDAAPAPAPRGPAAFLHRRSAAAPLPPEVRALEGKRYRLEQSYASLMPLILQAFTNNTPAAVEDVSFSFTPELCTLSFHCAGEELRFSAGLRGVPCRSYLSFNGESYPVGCTARIAFDEDHRLVLKLYLCFLQTPCVRAIKCVFYAHGSKLLLRFDEMPRVADSMEMLFGLVNSGDSSLQKAMGDASAQKKLRVRMHDIALPRAHGVWEEPAPTQAATAVEKE